MTQSQSKGKKVAILITILLLPSFFYLILYSGKHNTEKLPYIGPKDAIEREVDGKTVVDTTYHKIPPFSFTNQYGKKITNKDFTGKIYVADFFFATCPSICPKMATHLLEVQKTMADRDDFRILSHTVNPEHDSVEVLLEYANKVHADSSVWHFVTGPKEDIYGIAFNGYFANASPDSIAPGGFLHSQMLFLIDRQGHIRGLFDGTSTTEMKKLIDAIDLLYFEEYIPRKNKAHGDAEK